MRILVHDFAGYPYPAQLSRALARRGHTVRHVFCASIKTTPGGNLQPQPSDPETLQIRAVELDEPLDKYSFFKRWRQEREHGRRIAAEVDDFRPDAVLSGNSPLDAHRPLMRACRRHGARFIFWVQDLIGIAAHRILSKKIPVLGSLVGRYYLHMERSQLRHSDEVVMLTDDFRPLLREWGLADDRLHTIENWAPIDEFPLRPRNNDWARSEGLHDKRCLIYAGTLAMKHNPNFLLQTALHLRDRDDVRVVVLSEGLGADWLHEQKKRHHLDNLVLRGFLPFEMMPDVMATAEVLMAVLEPDAGVFSVPSKVLAYLCAQRPVLLAVPPENLIARIVKGNEAGLVVGPDDEAGFVAAAERLLEDAGLCERLGRNGRAYAETTFNIHTIARSFEAVLTSDAAVTVS